MRITKNAKARKHEKDLRASENDTFDTNHESTKYEKDLRASENDAFDGNSSNWCDMVVSFRVFELSCFRDCIGNRCASSMIIASIPYPRGASCVYTLSC